MRLTLLYAVRDRGEASPAALAGLLAPETRPVPAVAYHVRRLLEAGLIELARTQPVRGALEHHYRLTELGRAWLNVLDLLHRF
jgi:predicted ArsR family transcriptional regulator